MKWEWLKRSVVCGLALILLACGGDDEEINDFVDVTDVRLESLEVIAGGELMLDENPVEAFDPNQLGTYRIDLENDTTESVTLRASVADTSASRLFLILNDASPVAVNSGEDIVVDLVEGINSVRLRVDSVANAARGEYRIQVNRISSSSAIQDLVIAGVRGSLGSSGVIDFSAVVAADVLEYDVSIDRGLCGVSLVIEPESRQATVRVNGEEVDWRASTLFNLQPEVSTEVAVQIVAEDGSSTTDYIVNLLRDAQSETEQASDTTLSSLSVSPGRPSADFVCSNSLYSHVVNQSETSGVSITATISDDRPDVTMRIGLRDADVIGTVLDEDSAVAISSGVAYDGALFDDLAVGENRFLIEVVGENGSSTRLYDINIQVSGTNLVYVSTVAELQSALRSAQANDEIVVSEGEYLGVVSDGVEGSGSLLAHFYVNASGTQEEPIIVRPEIGDEVLLLGDDLSALSVLLIEGEYWQIHDVGVSGAQNGVVMDGASNITLNGLDVESVGERGVVFQNGTSDSLLTDGSIDHTGLDPETRVGIDEVYGEGVVVGEGSGAAANNIVSHVLFGRNIANEHVEIKSNGDSSVVQFNIFESDNTLIRPVAARTIVLDGGADSDLSYNQFDYFNVPEGADTISQIVGVDTEVSSVTLAAQNFFDLDDQAMTLISNLGSGTVQEVQTARLDEGVVSLIGVDTVSMPVFQIQSVLDSSLCMSVGDVFEEDTLVEDEVAIFVTCADETAQQWMLNHVGDGFVQLVRNTPEADTKLGNGVLISGTGDTRAFFVGAREDSGDSLDQSFSLLWTVHYVEGGVSIQNRAISGFYISKAGVELSEDLTFDPEPAFLTVDDDEVSIEFNLLYQ